MSMLMTSDEKNIIPTHVVNEHLHNRGRKWTRDQALVFIGAAPPDTVVQVLDF